MKISMNGQLQFRAIVIVIAAAFAGCSEARQGMEGHKDALAVAEGYKLTIEHAADLLAAASEEIAPTELGVIDRLVDLWVGYTVLGVEYTRPNQYAGLDLDPITRFSKQQELAWQLRDDVLEQHQVPDDSLMRELYLSEQPFTRVMAYHILISVRAGATEAEVDSLRRLAESIRERAVAGESFEELARTYSEDPGSASRGGRLGWMRRGRLVPEIDGIMFDLEPGEISEVIETRFGFDIVMVTERDVPEFETVRERYKEELLQRRVPAVEQAFIDSVTAAADIEIAPASIDLVRFSAFAPRLTRLGSAERSATLVRFRGGEITFGEWADFVTRGAPNTKAAFAISDTLAVAEMLRSLAMNEILANAALERGHSLSQFVLDSITNVARGELRLAAMSSGFRRARFEQGEDVPTAVDRALNMLFVQQRGPRDFDRVSPTLKRKPSIVIYPHRFPLALERLRELRASMEEGGAEEGETESTEAGTKS